MEPVKNHSKKLSIFLEIGLIIICVMGKSHAQNFEGLQQLEGFQLKVYYSEGAQENARDMASRCDNVMTFYKPILNFQPTVALLVLSPQDWSKHTSFPVYGMPHYTSEQTLIVASENNEFWKSFIPPLHQLPADLSKQISQTYSDGDGSLSMRGFFNLLAIHELGHAYHIQGGLTMQRKWMGELFCNIFLHTYIAEKEPELLPALTLFPQMVVTSTKKEDLKYTTLEELETNYNALGQQFPTNYGWYQCRWHAAAGTIYDEGGINAIKNLWTELKNQKEPLDDVSFETLLSEKVHQSVADVPLKWNE